ncbi:MAG: FeoA family protein [Bdellovibrionales bacterium]
MRPLSQLEYKKKARIVSLKGDDFANSCCIEMGLCQDSVIEVLGRLPFGGPMIILSQNGKYIVRKKDMESILVEEI